MLEHVDPDLQQDELQLQQQVEVQQLKESYDIHAFALSNFGKVSIEVIKGSFVIRTRRSSDHSIVLINVCSCDSIPQISHQMIDPDIPLLYLIISEIDKSIYEYDVYDVAIHPKIIKDISSSKQMPLKVKVWKAVRVSLSS